MSLRRRTQPQTGPWTPSRLGGALQLWLDATDSTTLTTTGSSVSQWRDKSSYGNNASQTTAALQPTLTSTAINGLPALSLSSDQLDIPSLVLTGQGYTFFAAATMTTSTASNGRLLAAKATGIFSDAFYPTNWTILMRSGTSANLTAVHNSVQLSNIGSVSYSTPFIVDSELNAGVRIFINGTAAGSSATSSDLNTTAGVRIGNDMEGSNGTQYWNGLIGEIICGRELSDAEKQLVRGYLAWKWGTTASLPNDHPYKSNSSLFILPPYTIPLVSYNFQDSTAADGTSANGGTLTNVGSGGSALNGLVSGPDITWTTGYEGRALSVFRTTDPNGTSFSGVKTAVPNASLNSINNFTIMARLKAITGSSNLGEFFHAGVFDVNENLIASLYANNNAVRVAIYPESASSNNPNVVNTVLKSPTTTWTHYCVTYDGTTTTIYIDGTSSASSTAVSGNLRQLGNRTIFIGTSYGIISGQVDDFRLYSTVLTQAEIAAIASS